MTIAIEGLGPVPNDVAFKEWAVIVRALEDGRQDLIFRKGGIAEEGRGFQVEQDAFYLFPTYFHQQRAGIRDAFAPLLDEAFRREPPAGRVVITSWVRVKNAFIVEREVELAALEARHVYAREVLVERLHGRYGKTLHALEVEVHRLAMPLDFPILEAYAGCKSWVTLGESRTTD
jgi:hypothetical protein